MSVSSSNSIIITPKSITLLDWSDKDTQKSGKGCDTCWYVACKATSESEEMGEKIANLSQISQRRFINTMAKKLTDILLSLVGIIFVLPLFPLCALLIKLDSKGPVFYLGDRIGKDGKPFKMYKFRTMYETPRQVGPSVSPHGDPRVTPLGRFLRRTKLNELPQFINVLKGDMTLLDPGPRHRNWRHSIRRMPRKSLPSNQAL